MGFLTFNELNGLGQPIIRTGRVTRTRMAAAVAARSRPKVRWATVAQERRPSARALREITARRFRSLFYPQPKTWTVTPEGKATPIHKVGETWSRAGVRKAELESWGPGYLETARFLRTPAGIARTKRLVAAARARRHQQNVERSRRAAVAKLKAAAAKRKRKRPRGISPDEARQKREAMIAWNARLSERKRITAAAARQKAATAVAWARQDVPAPRPVTTSYRTPTVTRGLVRGAGPGVAPHTLVSLASR